MKAAILEKYASDGRDLIVRDIPIPAIADGEGLKKISAIFAEKQVQTSLDEVFSLDDINKAMKKVASGRSRGKTVIKIA